MHVIIYKLSLTYYQHPAVERAQGVESETWLCTYFKVGLIVAKFLPTCCRTFLLHFLSFHPLWKERRLI